MRRVELTVGGFVVWIEELFLDSMLSYVFDGIELRSYSIRCLDFQGVLDIGSQNVVQSF